MIFIYIVCSNLKEATRIGKAIVKKRLAACANIFPIQSFYWWQKKIVRDKEIVLILKSPKKNFSVIEKEVKKIHSYKVPCIVAWSMEKVSQPYLAWLMRETR